MGLRTWMAGLVVTMVVVLAGASSGDAANCGGATACACGDNVTSDYTMTADLDCSGAADENKNGLNVKSNVVLNCDGHSIIGGDVDEKFGVRIDGVSGVSVLDCSVSHFDSGIRVSDASDVEILTGDASLNMQYGVEVSDSATAPDTLRVSVIGMLVFANGDEGIHVSGRAGVVPSHRLVGNVVVGQNCEGIYILNVDGVSGTNGITVTNNNIWGNGSGGGPDNCAAGAAGLYIDGSDRNAFRYNALTHDNVQLVGGSSNNKFLRNNVNFGSFRLSAGSNSNQFSRDCALGDADQPTDGFEFNNSDNNSCDKCAIINPADDHIVAQNDSDGISFTNLWIAGNTYSEDVSADSSVTHTFGAGGPTCVQ